RPRVVASQREARTERTAVDPSSRTGFRLRRPCCGAGQWRVAADWSPRRRHYRRNPPRLLLGRRCGLAGSGRPIPRLCAALLPSLLVVRSPIRCTTCFQDKNHRAVAAIVGGAVLVRGVIARFTLRSLWREPV